MVSPYMPHLDHTVTLCCVVQQRNFSMSVNSAAVLRLTGRGGGVVAGAPRGRSSSRGRGEYCQSQSRFRSYLKIKNASPNAKKQNKIQKH